MFNFQAQQPRGIQAGVTYAPQSGGGGKGSILDLALGVGLGVGTGNWAPLANQILPGSGSALGALGVDGFGGGGGGGGGDDENTNPQNTPGGVMDSSENDEKQQSTDGPTLASAQMVPELGQPLWNHQPPRQQQVMAQQQMAPPTPQFFIDPNRWLV